MNITKNTVDDKLNIALEGRLDTSTSGSLEQELLNAYVSVKDIVLDFEKLSYISSAGLRSLLIGQKTANSKGGTMKIINISQPVMEVLKMTGFANILNVK